MGFAFTVGHPVAMFVEPAGLHLAEAMNRVLGTSFDVAQSRASAKRARFSTEDLGRSYLERLQEYFAQIGAELQVVQALRIGRLVAVPMDVDSAVLTVATPLGDLRIVYFALSELLTDLETARPYAPEGLSDVPAAEEWLKRYYAGRMTPGWKEQPVPETWCNLLIAAHEADRRQEPLWFLD